MHLAAKRNQLTVCKDDTCLTVIGEAAKVLAVVVAIALVVRTAGELVKLLR